MQKIYVFNPKYDLRVDNNRILIMNHHSGPLDDDFQGFVHPVYAIMLSFFDGERTLGEIISMIEKLLRMPQEEILKILTRLIENPEEIFLEFDSRQFSFPKNTLVEKGKDNSTGYRVYNTTDFFIPRQDLDMKSWRLFTPISCLHMINTFCLTDCIYCYADRSKKINSTIPIERLKEIISEAGSLKFRTFDITGGELFLYDHWQEYLSCLLENGFNPYISTKCPLDSKTVHTLKDLGIKRIQISIDSIDSNELQHILKVNSDYHPRLMETFRLLQENDFEIYTNSQVCSWNSNSIDRLLDFLKRIKNIKRINIGAAGFSIYRGLDQFQTYKINLETIKRIENMIETAKTENQGKISINFSGYSTKEDLLDSDTEKKRKNFGKRARCSGNFFGFVLLPDGKVTVCEELYWHPKFIIGDLNRQSIMEMWHSPEALNLYHLAGDSNLIRPESNCKTCDEFDQCHKILGICWKEVQYAYGPENWDYPDPKCPKANMPMREYFI